MNSELAALAERLTLEYEAAEEAARAAQATLRDIQAEIARVRNAAKLLDEPDPFAEALRRRKEKASAPAATAPAPDPKPRPREPLPAKNTPRAQAEALFGGPRNDRS